MFRSKLKETKKEFKQQIKGSFKLIQSIGQISLPQKEIYLIYELSFLKIFLAWEWFIEKTFILYMISKKANKGSYVNPKNEKHAYDFVREGRDYVDWTSPDVVIRKAKIFFKDGKPYKNALNPIIPDIQDMKTLRNAIVHISKESQDKFKSLVRKKVGYAKAGITPGEFLFMSVGIWNSNIIYFRNQLEIISDKIVR